MKKQGRRRRRPARMSNGLMLLCFVLFAYGFSNMVVFGSGPFRIFEHLRYITSSINEHFGQLFSCMMCFPANLGWLCSILNWLFIPFAITPGNMIFAGMAGMWWLAMLFDCCFTSGCIWLIHHFEEFFENLAEGQNQADTDAYTEEEDNVIDTDDITRKRG